MYREFEGGWCIAMLKTMVVLEVVVLWRWDENRGIGMGNRQ